jgi:hypothetical protein
LLLKTGFPFVPGVLRRTAFQPTAKAREDKYIWEELKVYGVTLSFNLINDFLIASSSSGTFEIGLT